MAIGIVLSNIVAILFDRFMGSKFFEPDLEVMVKNGFIMIDEDRGRDMHGIDKHQSLLDPTLF